MKLLNITSLISNLKISTNPHPEYPEVDQTEVQFFTEDLKVLPILIQDIISELGTTRDFEITPNIFYNCDDQNYLITTTIIN